MGAHKNGDVIEKRTVLYNEAVTLTGYGVYNLYVLLAAGGCLMCVIVETMSMSFVTPAAQCDLNLSLAQKGILASIAFIGVFVSSHMWGFLADTRGRKNVLVFCLISSSVLSLICSIVPWAWLFILLRFLNGALIGGSSSIIYAFAGEFHNDRFRPMIISWISSFVALGQTYIPGLAWAILPATWSYELPAIGITFRPWRLLVIVYAVPSLIVAALLAALPESPKFLLTEGKHDETLRILTKMYRKNTGKRGDLYPVKKIILDEIPADKDESKSNVFVSMWRQTVPLFHREHVFKTIFVSYLQFGVFLSASALQLWFPEILTSLNRYSQEVSNSDVQFCKSVNYKPVDARSVANLFSFFSYLRADNVTEAAACNDEVTSDVYPVILGVGVAIGVAYIIIGAIINKIGKKQLLAGVAFVTAACGLTAQYIYGYVTILVLVGIFLLISSCIGIVNAFVVDLYPTNIRAMALAISLMFGRIGAAVGSNLVGIMFYNYCDYLFIMFGINHILLILSAILLPKPPKVNISIEDPK
ncbi:synaptic vesicle glycoprotein 2C-like isoform X2 [Cylas formicarius]|uniref:synaptic vesicle glycoprotein 2C-like isoform X2 n=1 Tax=Cylas formicarius TaxID=197179 RepID=UPI002958C042|nr:synaptic vesicle glycoprotein 2C-like isoform X2 [Cylas formicarius]